MTLLLFACLTTSPSVAQPPPTLDVTLQRIEGDIVALQAPAVSTEERAQLALEIRADAAKLRALTEGQPPRVHELALDVERQSGRLVAALGPNDPERVARESAALSARLAALRAATRAP